MPRIRSTFLGVVPAFLILGCVASFFTGKHIGFDEAADRRRLLPNGSILCNPGPWGNLSYTPFTIAAPDELLPVRSIEANGTHWVLKGYTSDSFIALLESTSLTPTQQRAFLDPAVLHVQPDGVELTPPPDLVFSLPDDARGKIYLILAQSMDNFTEINFIPSDTLEERFSDSGVSAATVALFKQLCYQRGNYLIFSSQAAIFSRLPSFDEKLRLVKALTRQRTLLLRLHITPDSDVEALARYWGKGCWDTDVRTIFQSLTAIPNGTWMSISIVLPPIPSSELDDFPTIVDNPLDGPPVNRDCHWTSLNFFRDVPDPNFGKMDHVVQELKDNYYPDPGDPCYGDVVLFTKADGTILHSAVYLADDICFTKNGCSAIQPWMLATIPDILEQYSILIPSDQKITISYYRNKRI